MSDHKMHAGEVDISSDLVRRLIAGQMPQWADLTITPLTAAGTDNVIYRLGVDMLVRLPRMASAAGRIKKESHWLPKFAPHLPLSVPEPLALGVPGAGYPYPWSVYRWIDGVNATADTLDDLNAAAVTMAGFIRALWAIDAAGGPPPGEHNFGRGVPLAKRDTTTRRCIRECAGMIDTVAAAALWTETLQIAAWDGMPTWIHGDLQSGNLLARAGRLAAVIDFGGLGVGDPACDLQVAWNLFDVESRDRFREATPVDEATWLRGRGWALSVAVIALPYYVESNPTLAEISRRTIQAVLADYRGSQMG